MAILVSFVGDRKSCERNSVQSAVVYLSVQFTVYRFIILSSLAHNVCRT